MFAALTTPFYSASLVETVQSDIACEKPGVFDIFREGLFRLAPGYSSGGRLVTQATRSVTTVAALLNVGSALGSNIRQEPPLRVRICIMKICLPVKICLSISSQ